MSKFQELLNAVSSAVNATISAIIRAVACRNIDSIAGEWTAALPTVAVLQVTAIASSVRAPEYTMSRAQDSGIARAPPG